MVNLPQPSDYEIEQKFMDFLNANNLSPAGSFRLMIDGTIQRYRLPDDKRGQKSGAYCVYTDKWPIGWAMDWHTRDKIEWYYPTEGLNDEQRKYFNSPEFKAECEAAKKQREEAIRQKQVNAAEQARIRIDTCPEAPENHPYLQKKHIYPYGVKLDGESLAVPLKDINGLVHSLQWIERDGKKKNYPDAPLEGLFWSVGLDLLKSHPSWPILLGEGFATMAKVYELTGYPSVAGISCYYLKKVAQALKEKYPQSKVIVMADNDKATELKRDFNPGIEHAKELVKTKLAVDVVYPEFEKPEDGTDWDDYAIRFGDDETAKQLGKRIDDILIPDDIKEIQKHTVVINAQDLRTKIFPPIKWAVDGFLPSGLSILAGGPKVGKSILALHLAVGVAIGGCVLGNIFVQKGDVLYLALEDNQRRLQERINGGAYADVDDDMSSLDIVTEIPRQHVGGLSYIRWWLSKHKEARLVIIDTLQMFRKQFTGKGSMYAEDYDVISEIKKLADEFDVAFLIIHHLKKGMEGDWLSEISGSQGIAGAADTIFSLKRDRNSVMGVLHRTGRDVEEKDFMMKLEGYGWILQGDVDDFTIPEWKKQILDFLKENPTVSPMQLMEKYSISHNAARTNLYRLAKEGLIVKTGYGTYSLPE